MKDARPLIRCENVGKKFCRNFKKSLWYGVQDIVGDYMLRQTNVTKLSNQDVTQQRLRRDEFWANQGISFDLQQGECLGLIGRNGAGKTTLLKLLSGLIKPDIGTITIRGRVGALIALGAGFNPLLSGRENIYINGAILGLKRREVAQKFDEIVAFSELEKFIDAPVRTYSSGMSARLGFATASYFDCDILLIDEVLAVGDFAFRQKCFRRLATYVAEGGSAILVSHALEQVMARTNRAILLDTGKVVFDGPPREALHQYENRVVDDLFAKALENHWRPGRSISELEDTPVQVHSARFYDCDNPDSAIYPGAKLSLEVVFHCSEDMEKLLLGVAVFSQHEVSLLESAVECVAVGGETYRLVCDFNSVPLRPSAYPVQIRIHDHFNCCLFKIDRKDFLLRVAQPRHEGLDSFELQSTSILDVDFQWKRDVMGTADGADCFSGAQDL